MNNCHIKLSDAEYKLTKIIWEKGEIKSNELVYICEEKFGWKKSTTYTILKRVCVKGIIENNNTIISPIISEITYIQNELNETYGKFSGSIPSFIATFIKKEKLDISQITELQQLIEEYKVELDE